jgi:hypothetical protein
MGNPYCFPGHIRRLYDPASQPTRITQQQREATHTICVVVVSKQQQQDTKDQGVYCCCTETKEENNNRSFTLNSRLISWEAFLYYTWSYCHFAVSTHRFSFLLYFQWFPIFFFQGWFHREARRFVSAMSNCKRKKSLALYAQQSEKHIVHHV